MKLRIDYLDGLRGIAILLVLGYHAFSRWPEVVPYGNTYAEFPLFAFGWLGVQLFFLISGFVIFMTLDKTQGFSVFIYKRLLRLFPAMLIISLLVFFTAPWLSERPAGMPNIYSLLPGLTFIEHNWWSKVLGFEIQPLEGAFWSLYVEFKFYVIAGVVYFLLGRRFLIPILFALFAGTVVLSVISEHTDANIITRLYGLTYTLSLQHFGWFCAGAMFYMFQHTQSERYYAMGVAVSIMSAIFVGETFIAAFALGLSALFAASLRVQIIQNILSTKIILFFGFISYPLYLIHENAMIAMTVMFSTFLPDAMMFFYPFIAIAILSAVTYVVAKKLEPVTKKYLNALAHPPMSRIFRWQN